MHLNKLFVRTEVSFIIECLSHNYERVANLFGFAFFFFKDKSINTFQVFNLMVVFKVTKN